MGAHSVTTELNVQEILYLICVVKMSKHSSNYLKLFLCHCDLRGTSASRCFSPSAYPFPNTNAVCECVSTDEVWLKMRIKSAFCSRLALRQSDTDHMQRLHKHRFLHPKIRSTKERAQQQKCRVVSRGMKQFVSTHIILNHSESIQWHPNTLWLYPVWLHATSTHEFELEMQDLSLTTENNLTIPSVAVHNLSHTSVNCTTSSTPLKERRQQLHPAVAARPHLGCSSWICPLVQKEKRIPDNFAIIASTVKKTNKQTNKKKLQ